MSKTHRLLRVRLGGASCEATRLWLKEYAVASEHVAEERERASLSTSTRSEKPIA